MTAAAVRATIHFKHPAHQERFIEALLQAGLPPGEPAELGERRPATVVAFRLAGPEQAGVAPDPEEVDERMSILRRAAEPHVAAHGGVLHPYTGDALAAWFGLSGAHEDDPVRAVRAAMAVCAAWDALAAQDNAGGLVPPALHIGIESGPVVVRPAAQGTGRPEAVGELLAVARRLAEQASPGEIVVGADALRHVQGFFAMEPIAAGAGPWRVAGDRAIETRFDAAERRGLTPLVGREPELALLHASLERALAGQGQLVTVSGEAGVGKSRLLYEFRQGLDRERVAVLQGRCQSYGATIPYFPLLDALRRGLQLHEESDPAKLHKTAVASIRAIDPALEPHIPLYLHLLTIPSADFPVPKRLQGPELQGAIHEAWAELTLASAQRQPLVWMLEDWHWADEASDAALQYLVGRMGPQPLLLLAAHRPDYQPGWGHPGHHTPIVLQALDARHGEALIKATWRAERLPEGLAALLLERTGGNPFFIEEACRTLAEEGAVRIEAGQAELTRPLARVALPETVQAVIRARLDRLAPEGREVLRLAAVIGREFDTRLLERIVPEPQRLQGFLEILRSLELVQPVRLLPEAAWRFKHALTQEVAYDSLLRAQRREVHAQVARAIEELYGDRIEEQVGLLAHHYGLAEEWEPAVRHGLAAAHKTRLLSQFQQAVRQCEVAIGWLGRLPDDRSRQEKLVDLYTELIWNLVSLGQFQRVEDQCMVAMPHAQALGDSRRLGLLHGGLGISYQYRGDFESTERCYRQSLGCMEQDGDAIAIAFAKHWLGSAHLGPGLWKGAESWISQAVAVYEQNDVDMPMLGFYMLPSACGFAQLGYSEAVLGKVDRAIMHMRQATSDGTQEASNLPTKMVNLSWVGLFVALMGEDRFDAMRHANQFLAVTERSDSPFQRLGGLSVQANILLGVGDFEGVRAVCKQALRIVEEGRIRTGHVANLRYNLALAEVALGDREAAGRHYEAGRELVELSPHWWGPRYEFLHGLLLAAGDPPGFEEAIAAFERSIAGDEEVGAVVPAAQTRYHLAILLGRQGRHERVRAMLDELVGQFAAWGIPVWEARCRQALSRLPAS
jgi:class 3 adenylate cyclase/tetratricopeptide (TPR) repeat protein